MLIYRDNVNQMINVILASQLAVLREGMKGVLLREHDIRVVAEISHPQEISSINIGSNEDVIVIAHPSVGDACEYLAPLQENGLLNRAILITVIDSVQQTRHLLRLGVRGLLIPNCNAGDLPAAIRAVYLQKTYLQEEVARLIAADIDEVHRDQSHTSLTKREYDIFLYLATGEKVSEIADLFGISIKTVSTHKARLMGKMGITSTSQLVRYAVENGLVKNSQGVKRRRVPDGS